MFTKTITTVLTLTVGTLLIGATSDDKVTSPTCCAKGAYCCTMKLPCCKHGETVAVAAKEVAAVPGGGDVNRPTCCAKGAYCCTMKLPCCKHGETKAVVAKELAAGTGGGDVNRPTCCAKGAYCCHLGSSCCR